MIMTGTAVSAQAYRVPLLEELPGHDHALDLVGALVDLGVVGRG
jgi:predicted neuraminidase